MMSSPPAYPLPDSTSSSRDFRVVVVAVVRRNDLLKV